MECDMSLLHSYTKNRDFLVCVDSDGCVMDTMTCKHVHCFGPRMIDEWGLDEWRDEILTRWNEINLYQLTRGINRFKGLAMALGEINEKYTHIPGIEAFSAWCETTHALSMQALSEAIAKSEAGEGRVCLEKALAWSRAVNASINELPDDVKVPFDGAKEGLAAAHVTADVAVVSSANREAVLEEWEHFGLIDHTDVTLTQDIGSKAYCIGEMLKMGYDKEKTLMVGDAIGDLQAAEANGVYFFPILTGKEKESWDELRSVALERLLLGTYGGEYQKEKRLQFINNFK